MDEILQIELLARALAEGALGDTGLDIDMAFANDDHSIRDLYMEQAAGLLASGAVELDEGAFGLDQGAFEL